MNGQQRPLMRFCFKGSGVTLEIDDGLSAGSALRHVPRQGMGLGCLGSQLQSRALRETLS